MDVDEDHETGENIIMGAISHARNIVEQGAQGSKVSSKVLDDAFHFMDRLLPLLSKKHPAFKEFAYRFSESIFLWDKDDEDAVRAVVEGKGQSWEYIKRAKFSSIRKRIRRYIPDPTTLVSRLELLFKSFQNIRAPSTKGKGSRFFSDDARRMADRLLTTVRLGYLSDPPGLPLYYLMGRDRDGLNIYRCIRGTNSVEGGVHMALRRMFGAFRASAELAEALLVVWFGRRNTSVWLLEFLSFAN